MCRGHPLVGVIGLLKKKRRNLYLLPSYSLRLLALPYLCRTATQKPTLVYAIDASGYISPEISCRKQDNYISTGIYRCSILDIDKKSLRDISKSQESARINAFLCIFTTSRSALPQTGASARRSATAKLAIIPDILSLQCWKTKVHAYKNPPRGAVLHLSVALLLV